MASALANLIADVNVGTALLLVAILIMQWVLLPCKNAKRITLYLLPVLAILFWLIPIYHGFTLVSLVRGTIGDLSISWLLLSIGLLGLYYANLPFVLILPRPLCLLLFVMGLLLYLSTLGVINIDLYDLGYVPGTLFLLAVALVIFLISRLNLLFATICLLSLISFYFKWQHSTNLWDYLFDPCIWLLSLIQLVKPILSKGHKAACSW